ncbi:hypothetical protein FOG18_03640 [Legionella israelensis]|uniref:hypothetical protein n=1 Tax=Legionella israelensis TaxID=454 RepID=UPI00117EEB50|nr:hypothetical protein [Legionella israelensis]QDP71727.1 hypothetical protein FOG18_03640 [Legionella israelensis]
MKDHEKKDLARIKELLTRTTEFVAYFELVETKMREWQQTIEQEKQTHLKQHQEQTQSLRQELDALHQLLSQTGMDHFRQSITTTLSQGEKQLKSLQAKGEKLVENMNLQLEHFNQFTEQSIEKIQNYTSEAITRFDTKLSQYDVNEFHRIVDESCLHIEHFSQNAINKNKHLLKSLQWRFLLLAIITTLLTTFVIGLYVSDEMPWETHQQAMNERQAGRVLLQAWPHLSHQERIKILKHETASNG